MRTRIRAMGIMAATALCFGANYCRAHPLSQIATAAEMLYWELRARVPK